MDYIPTVHDLKDIFPDSSSLTVAGLMQKVWIVCDNFAIGWAGRAIEAHLVIAKISERLEGRRVSCEEVCETLNQAVATANVRDCCFLGYLVDSTNTPAVCVYPAASRCQDIDLGEVFAIGSGARMLLAFLRQPTRWQFGTDQNNFIYCLSGMLTSWDLNGATSLLNYFGGGYEVTLYRKGKFRKLWDFSHIMWRCFLSSGAKLSLAPFHFTTHDYLDDILIMRSLQCPTDDASRELSWRTNFAVPPHRSFLKSDREKVMQHLASMGSWHSGFVSDFRFHTTAIVAEDGGIIGTHTLMDSSGHFEIAVTPSGVEVSDELQARIESEIRESCPAIKDQPK